MTRAFEVTPPGKLARVSLATLVLLASVPVPALMLSQSGAGTAAAFAVAIIALVDLLLLAGFRRRGVRLDGEALEVRAAIYTRRTAVAQLSLDAARILDLREHRDSFPALKTNGFSLPGFHAGHYRLRDGRRGFCLLTDPTRVLSLPERDGRQLLLSLRDPQALLAALRRLDGAAAARQQAVENQPAGRRHG